jgi:hypothetical protein
MQHLGSRRKSIDTESENTARVGIRSDSVAQVYRPDGKNNGKTVIRNQSHSKKMVLVIDDQIIEDKDLQDGFRSAVSRFCKETEKSKLGDSAIFIIPKSVDEALEMLRKEKFHLILLDGSLGLGLSSNSNNDGDVIASNLRHGRYGPNNEHTPIINISSAYEIHDSSLRADKMQICCSIVNSSRELLNIYHILEDNAE